MKSLVVEDDMISRKSLQMMLKNYGSCETAGSGTEAIEKFKSAQESGTPYSLICMDIMMPDMDGHQTLKQIRSVEKAMGISMDDQVQVMMTSALDDTENADKAFFEVGARSFIVKPVLRDRLIKELKRLGFVDQTAT